MDRRKSTVAVTVLLAAGLLFALSAAPARCDAATAPLFPTDVPGKTWVTFDATGFSAPACGVVYRIKDEVSCGMPLGGIDVGCIDLETSGLLGYCTIFNSHVPRRGPINLPVLGLSTGGKTWVLCNKQPKKQLKPDWDMLPGPVLPVLSELRLDGVQTPKEIHYWGHYPVADLEFETDAPVQVGLRAWAPFLPGDVVDSMIPAIIFEVHLRNTSGAAQKGTVAFSFPGPDPKEAGTEQFVRKELSVGRTSQSVPESGRIRKSVLLDGVEVRGKLASYAMGVIGEEKSRLGGELGADGAAWAKIASSLPVTRGDQPGSSAGVDFSLPPDQEKVVRFVVAWCAPTWNGVGYNGATSVPKGCAGSPRTFTHMYAKHYPSAAETAQLIAKNHASLLRRILAWQQVVYSDSSLPVWLRESLVNMLHLIAEDGLWAQAKHPVPGWVKETDGLFGLIECPRECPQIECIPCSFYGNIPLVYFFPELALSTLRGYKGYQYPDGAPPWIFSGCTGGTPFVDFAMPTRGYQATLNGPCYVDLVDRYLRCHGTEELVKEFYPSVKKAVSYTVGLNRGPDGVVSMPDRPASTSGFGWETEWFECVHWAGIVPHVGGVHLASLRMAERLAEQAGDRPFAAQCRKWIADGQKTLETKMWTGSYYLAFWDEKAGKKSDLIFGSQLDGQWMAEWHGLSGVFPPDHVAATLKTIKQYNVPPTRYGAIVFVKPDGTLLRPREFPLAGNYRPYDFFMSEVMMLGMTYMYNGQKELGLELTRRCMNNVVCQQGTTWNMPCIVLGDTGKTNAGSDYYQAMMLWSLPAAVEGKSLEAPCRPGGLVERVLKAAR